MQILRFGLAGVVAAGVLGAGVAGAATMHPVLGAKLAGMGEHGVVNFQSNASKGQLCWTFDVMTHGVTERVDPRRAGMVVAKLGLELQGEELRDGAEEGARADRVEARLLPRLGRHEGAIRASCAGRCSPAWRTCRCRRHGEDDDAEPQPQVGRARLPGARWLGGVSSLYWGKAVWSQRLRRALAGRGAHPAHPARAAGGSTPSPARMPRFDPQTWRLELGGHVEQADVDHLRRAAGAAEGRAGLDVPLRHRLDGEERPLGRRPAQRRARARAAEADAHALEFVSAEKPYVDYLTLSRPACTT